MELRARDVRTKCKPAGVNYCMFLRVSRYEVVSKVVVFCIVIFDKSLGLCLLKLVLGDNSSVGNYYQTAQIISVERSIIQTHN